MIFDRRLALLITQLAIALLLVNEIVQLSGANAKLNEAIDRQKPNEEMIRRIDTQLDALARGTARLAQGGNPQAQKIVDQLAQNGVRITDRPRGGQ